MPGLKLKGWSRDLVRGAKLQQEEEGREGQAEGLGFWSSACMSAMSATRWGNQYLAGHPGTVPECRVQTP